MKIKKIIRRKLGAWLIRIGIMMFFDERYSRTQYSVLKDRFRCKINRAIYHINYEGDPYFIEPFDDRIVEWLIFELGYMEELLEPDSGT